MAMRFSLLDMFRILSAFGNDETCLLFLVLIITAMLFFYLIRTPTTSITLQQTKYMNKILQNDFIFWASLRKN